VPAGLAAQFLPGASALLRFLVLHAAASLKIGLPEAVKGFKTRREQGTVWNYRIVSLGGSTRLIQYCTGYSWRL
jgi:hypothetical protein